MSLSGEKEKLLKRLRRSRLRIREGLFLVEGVRGVREFLQATLPLNPRFAVVSPRLEEVGGGPELRAFMEEKGLQLFPVADADLDALSDTETGQGVLLVVEEPQIAWAFRDDPTGRRVLLLDGIQDPGNVGTLVRAARAFGLDGILALEGTADPWGSKAVRSSAGALAHIPVAKMAWRDVRGWLRDAGIPLLVADADGMDVRGWSAPRGWVLVLGNEGEGVRSEVREMADTCLAIPMADAVESLNVAVAGAILLFALTPPPQLKVKP